MALKLGSTTLTALYLGSTAITAAYLGVTGVYTSSSEFSPLSLFASGEEGAWYEPSTTTAFSDLQGFNFATYGQGVAHLVDKSKGATVEARRNLLTYTEQFDNAVWDSLGFDRTSYTETDPEGGSTALLITENNSSTNPYFRYNADVSDGTAQTYSIWLKATSEVSGVNLSTTGQTSNSTITITTSWQKFDVTASTNHGTGPYVGGFATITKGSAIGIYLWHPQLETGSTATAYQKITTGQTLSWLPGNHATQVTAGARPILARVPEGGRRNLLDQTETLSSSTLIGVDTPTVSTTVDGNNVITLTDNATNTNHFSQYGPYQLSGNHTIAVRASAASSYIVLYMQTDSGIDRYCAIFDLSTQAVTTDIRGTPSGSNAISDLGNGYYLCSITFNANGADTYARVGLYDGVSGFGAGNFPIFTGDGTNGADFYGFQLEEGSTATAYQKVVDEYDVTEAGVTSLDYLSFDGSDDSFIISGSQAWYDQYIGSIVIAASTDSTSSQDVVSNRGLDSGGAKGKYALSIRNSGVDWTYDNLLAGSGVATSTASPINTPYVFYGSGDGTNVSSSINSGSVTTSADTFVARGLDAYIGQDGNSNTHFSGRIYGLVLTDDVLTADEISNTETYLAARSGVTL